MGNLNLTGTITGGSGTAAAMTRVDASSTNTTGNLVDVSNQFNITDASGHAVHPVFVDPAAVATLQDIAAKSGHSGFRVENDPTTIGGRLTDWATKSPEQHRIP